VIVVDAGAWVTALVDAGASGDAARRVLADDPAWTVPAHAPLEVLRTIRRFEASGLITTEQAATHAGEVRDAEVRYIGPERWILAAVWDQRHNISPYDVPYVALARRYDVPLVTLDKRLARAATDAGAGVIVPTHSPE
jgi:predicted nucleic acid-binding protein